MIRRCVSLQLLKTQSLARISNQRRTSNASIYLFRVQRQPRRPSSYDIARLRRAFSSSPDDSDKDEKHANQQDKPISSASPILDPPIITWVDDYLPRSIQPYTRLARMDKPIGTWLLLWPCFWSTALAASSLPDPMLLGLFGAGAFIMRGAGCTINDLWDRKVDKHVARTAHRPLASNQVSVSQAIAFLGVQLTAGLGILLSLPHTWYCFQWGAASLPLVVAYPLMKRFFPYPQLVLGLTFNWGAFMGWAAVHGSMDYGIILPLYGSGVTWTLVYDTIYAHQDKQDDAKLGLHSTALSFGLNDETQKNILYALATATWLQWQIVGAQADLSSGLFSFGSAVGFGHLLWQIKSADFNDPHNVAARFRSNSAVGAIMFATFAASTYFA
jgi:4-hydroxybenzoate polyprenyltransferase